MPESTPLDKLKHAATDTPVVDLILQRWSPRAFLEKPVSEADLKTIFMAAAWAASSFNEQPWRFVVGRKGDETWHKIFDALMPPNKLWNNTVPVLIASFAKKTFSHNGTPNGVAQHDVGAASANLSLQATALGLHTHGMAGFDKHALHTALAVPADFEPVACWALGYLGNPESLPENFRKPETQPRTRKAIGEIVFSSWDKPAL
jgi:nitroreductase